MGKNAKKSVGWSTFIKIQKRFATCLWQFYFCMMCVLRIYYIHDTRSPMHNPGTPGRLRKLLLPVGQSQGVYCTLLDVTKSGTWTVLHASWEVEKRNVVRKPQTHILETITLNICISLNLACYVVMCCYI